MADKDALASFQRNRQFKAGIKKRGHRSEIAKRAVADVEARRQDKERAHLETIECCPQRTVADVEARRKKKDMAHLETIDFFPHCYDGEAKPSPSTPPPPPNGGGLFLLSIVVKVARWGIFYLSTILKFILGL
jgi:hypothetical protein